MMDFITFARAHGLEINPAKFYAGPKIKRCGTVDKPKGTNGAYFCMIAAKGTIQASAGIVKAKGADLLAVWASPQLPAQGKKLPGKDSIKGVYGTQNTLPCKG